LLAGLACLVLAGCTAGPEPRGKSSRGSSQISAGEAKGTAAGKTARKKSAANDDIPPASQLDL
jgi:hypothetical protein